MRRSAPTVHEQPELPLFTTVPPSPVDRLPLEAVPVRPRRSRAARAFFQLGELFRRQATSHRRAA